MISVFPKGKLGKENKIVPATIPEKKILFDDYLEEIRSGTWEYDVLAYRKGQIKKAELPGITPSGVFSYRSSKHLEIHSGFIAIDIDAKDQTEGTDFDTLKIELQNDQYTYAIHNSASGNGGMVVYIKISPDKHLESFLGIEKYYLDNYKVIIDPSGKDVSRFRFVSFDPSLTINRKSKTFRDYIKKVNVEPLKHHYIFTNNDLDHVFTQIESKWIDLTDSYSDWYRIGCALQNHYGGEKGRDLFHMISNKSAKYNSNDVDKLYDLISKRNPDKVVTIGTLLWLCKNAGIDIMTPQTREIRDIAKARIKSVGKNGGMKSKDDAIKSAIETAEMNGFNKDEASIIAKQVAELPSDELNAKSDDVLADLKAFLSTFDIRFNEITRNYELNGEPMTDRDYNSLYIKAIDVVDDRITKDRLFSLIDSENTPSYNPFQEFFKKHKNIKPSGNFEALCKCIKYDQVIEDNGVEHYAEDYLQIFLKKWLLGIISSAHGTYSILILVMTGGQRAGKTKFFRNLLPDELMSFYAESKLDDGKDSEILMTKKLIILDDEFGGKSKHDAKRLKELSSKQWFNIRRPFGRTSEDLRRLAVLCGTSNEDEVINDPTGNRRIIPLNILDIDHEKMEEIDKVALFMELYHEWKEDPEKFMLTKNEIAFLNRCSINNEEISFEEEMVTKYFRPSNQEDRYADFFTNTDIKNFIEDVHKNLRLSPKKLGSVLKRLGYEKRQHRKDTATPIGGYWIKRV